MPVFYLGDRAAQLTPLLLGFAAGVMGVASIAGLLIPAGEEGSALAVIGGLAVGASLLGVVRWKLSPRATFMGHADSGARTSALVFLVLFVHSLPEGFAVGTAFASDRAGLSLFVILAIAIQNIPEGTSVAIPMAASGFSRTRQFWAAVMTSAPQPVGALIALSRRHSGDGKNTKGDDRGRDQAEGDPGRPAPAAAQRVLAHQLAVLGQRADEREHDEEQDGVERLGEEEDRHQRGAGISTTITATSTTAPKLR